MNEPLSKATKSIKRIRIGRSTVTLVDNTEAVIQALLAARLPAALAAAEMFKDRLIDYQQTVGQSTWTPIEEDWKATKEALGQSTNIMEASGALIESIEIRPGPSASAEVGWFDQPHPQSGLTVGELQAVHEFGIGVPKREWMTPVADSARSDAEMLAAVASIVELGLGRFT